MDRKFDQRFAKHLLILASLPNDQGSKISVRPGLGHQLNRIDFQPSELWIIARLRRPSLPLTYFPQKYLLWGRKDFIFPILSQFLFGFRSRDKCGPILS